MNTDAAISLLQTFLARSPRSALEVRVMLDKKHWCWRHGHAWRVRRPVFEIGSVGKVFTTTLLAQMVQHGRVSLSNPVSLYYPQLPCAQRITLRQLASHTSGLPRNTISQWRLLRQGRRLADASQPDDLLVFLQGLPPKLRGTGKVRYSNVGMALLGRILGDVRGQSYGQAVRESILEPLGMHDTHLESRCYPPERLMQGHDARGRPVPPLVWKGMEPAGVWRSTGEDMMLFLEAQMGLCGEPWRSLAVETTQPLARKTRDTRIGLGWMLGDHVPWGPVAWHNGGTFGQHCIAVWALDHAAAVVLLTDRSPPWWHHLLRGRQLEELPLLLLAALRTAPTSGSRHGEIVSLPQAMT